MDVRITIFERRREGRVYWTPLRTGALAGAIEGASPLKLQQRLTDTLRKAIGRLWPAELEPLEFVSGRRLEFHTLEITAGETRRRLRARLPLVLEPRSRGPLGDDEAPLWIVYHPMRSSEWFVHDEGRLLADEAIAFFRERWAALDDAEVDALLSDGRECLKLVAFQAKPRSLFDRLATKPDEPPRLGSGQAVRGQALLAELGADQTQRAAEERLPRGAPRAPYDEQLAQLVCGPRKTSVLLVGASGSGKSTLLNGLVHELLAADGWALHRNLDRVHSVWLVRGNRILAGMMYLGDWEQRCVDLLDACRQHRAILWVDDLHAWGRIGESTEADRSLATFFRGPVARGELTIVAECTAEQYQMLQDDAPELAAAFTVLWIEPTDPATTSRLVYQRSRALELAHGVGFDVRAFRTIAELGGALVSGTSEPGKSIELLEALAKGDFGWSHELRAAEHEVAQGQKIPAIRRYRELTGCGLKEAKDAVEHFQEHGVWPAGRAGGAVVRRPVRSLVDRRFGTEPDPPIVGPQAVVRLLARRTGIPELMLVPERSLSPATITSTFATQLVGQPRAIAAVTDVLTRMRAQLADAGRPYGVLLFSGPTGTGKTELAKCLAEYLYGDARRLVRLDMSEYSGPDAAARLVGERGRPEGTLTTPVRAQPFCVVLLDEIDKADPTVLGLMLQVFDDGRITDASGTLVDFSHTVVLLTSNLGARRGPAVGFGDDGQASSGDVERAVREFFPPELFNRIDRIVTFDALAQTTARRIAERELSLLLERAGLVERNIFVRRSPAVVDLVVARGFAQRDGARSLKRWIEDHVGAWLADEIAGRPPASLRVFWLHVRDGELALHAEHLHEAEVTGEPGALANLLELDARRLRLSIPGALARTESMLDGAALEELASTMRVVLARSQTGDLQAAETAYNLESLRGELLTVRDRLRVQADYDPILPAPADDEVDGDLIEADRFGFSHVDPGYKGAEIFVRTIARQGQVPTLPIRTRPEVLEQLAELRALEHAVVHASDPAEHTVMIELSRVSQSRAKGRFTRGRPGLLEWLAQGYTGGRGNVDEAIVALDDGTTYELSPFDAQRFEMTLGQAARVIVLRITGPGVRSFFAAEHGSHVRHSVSGATEVVRVRVLPDTDTTVAAHVAALDAARIEFVHALESGVSADALPSNPDGVPPVVRAYHFDPAPTGAPAPIDVEDFAIALAMRLHVRALADVLKTVWMLRPDVVKEPA